MDDEETLQHLLAALHDMNQENTELAEENAELEAKYDAESIEARRDALTGLGNLKKFRETHEHWHQLAYREGAFYRIDLFDIAGLKDANERDGMIGGDKVLNVFAETLRKTYQRPLDTICRIGGDEFAVIYGDEDPHPLRERLVRELERTTRGAEVEPIRFYTASVQGEPVSKKHEVWRHASDELKTAKERPPFSVTMER